MYAFLTFFCYSLNFTMDSSLTHFPCYYINVTKVKPGLKYFLMDENSIELKIDLLRLKNYLT